jgi:hypothetical protein
VFSALEWQDDGFPLLRGIRGAGEYAGAQIGLFAFADGRYAEVNVARFCGMPRDAKDLDPKDPRIPHVESTNDVTAWRGPFEVCQLDFPR